MATPLPAPTRPKAKRIGALARARKLVAVEIPVPARPSANSSAVRLRQASPVAPPTTSLQVADSQDEVDELMDPVGNLVSATAKDVMLESCPNGGASPQRATRQTSLLSVDADGEVDNDLQAPMLAKKSVNAPIGSRRYSFRSSTMQTSPAKQPAASRKSGTGSSSEKAAKSTSNSFPSLDSSVPVLDISGPVDRFYSSQDAFMAAQSASKSGPRPPLQPPAATAECTPLNRPVMANSPSTKHNMSTQLLSFFDKFPANSPDASSTSRSPRQLLNRPLHQRGEQDVTSTQSQTESTSSQADELALKPKIEQDTEDIGESVSSASAMKKGKMPAAYVRGKN